jgi:hypothetical protein
MVDTTAAVRARISLHILPNELIERVAMHLPLLRLKTFSALCKRVRTVTVCLAKDVTTVSSMTDSDGFGVTACTSPPL